MSTRRRKRVTSHRTPATNGTRNILVIGDVHVGSIYGLLPPDFVSQEFLKDFNAAVDQLQKKQERFQAEHPFRAIHSSTSRPLLLNSSSLPHDFDNLCL